MATVIFDLDGTLADTSADLIASANSCFRRLGHGDVLDPAQDALTAFHGGRAMLRLGFERVLPGSWDEAMVDREYPLLLEAYGAAIDHHTRLYPGAIDAVERLAAAGYRVGICTNKPSALAEVLMSRLGVRDRFASLVGSDTLSVRKPDPAPFRAAVERAGGDPTRAILIGDTATDRETARAAGVACVLVTFGPEGRGVARLEPDALLDHYDGLFEIATGLLPLPA
ncbi:HAD family hydrolase [Thioclava sp. BHET1]|nr:HAD family hydrolase [Thioclava sp. BHET1]